MRKTAVFGYSSLSDRVVQYPVEVVLFKQKPKTESWVEQIFARKPIRPGYWKFTWEPGHGSDVRVYEEVSFDPSREVFVEKQRIVKLHP